MRRFFRTSLAFIVLLLVCGLAVAYLRLVVATLWLARCGPARRRTVMARANLIWCSRIFRVWAFVSGIGLDWSIGKELDLSRRPVLVVANHVSEYDIPVVAEVLRRLGVEGPRWVGNAEILRYPLLRAIFRDIAIPVERRKGSSDLCTVEEAARIAARERQTVVIFPEGATYREECFSPEWHGVLRPRRGGFSVLARRMPDHAVLTVVISYGGRVRTGVLPLGDYIGRTIRVQARFCGEMPGNPEKWLEDEWRRLERLLPEMGGDSD